MLLNTAEDPDDDPNIEFDPHDARRLLPLLPNDFEPLVLRTHEPVAQVKKLLYDSGAVFAQMSGSGSSVYGLFGHETDVMKAADDMRKQYQVFITPPHFVPA